MEILNLEELLQPISEAAPSGSDQSATPQYLQAIEAMREDDPTISRQPWEEVKAAEWGKAERLCEELLSKKTKDLTVAFWYTDALLRTHGLAGLSEGLQLVSGIIDQFWDTFHPQLSEPNDLYRRMNVVMKFMNKFNEKLGLIPITKPSAGDSKPYTWANYNEASYVDKLPANDQKAAVENGRATTALFAASLKSTPNDFILQLNDATEQLSDIVKNMESVLVEHCEALRESLDEKSDADVSFSVVHESLDIFLQFSQRQIKERGLRKPEPAKQVTAQNADDSRNGVQSSGGISGGYAMGPGMGIGDVQSRDDAYNALDGLADFLMMAEPHSPVPYLLKRAVKWGRMNGQDMFRELYNNAADLNTLYRLLDIGEYDSSSPYSAPAQSYSAPVQSHPAPQQQAPASQPDAANDPYAGW